MNSMTGFASREADIAGVGKVCVELRSTNYKFLETVCHLPEGFLALEERIKKAIEARAKRGRITCVVSVAGKGTPNFFVNKPLLKKYITMLRSVKMEFGLRDDLGMDALIHLPGVLSVEEGKISKADVWPRLKVLLNHALSDFSAARHKEGRALNAFFRRRAGILQQNLASLKLRFKKATKAKLSKIAADEDASKFLKDTDISEEIERLGFHIRNFKSKLSKSGSIGKELDFIAQEMQREANTLSAKSFDLGVSARAVQIKSQVEKIREQVQNIE